MYKSGFDKFYWGFLFVMINFRIQGFDVLPDIIGYILFAMGFKILAEQSNFFKKAALFNIPMIILSVFSIYQAPANAGTGTMINFGPLGLLGIPLMIAGIVLSLLVVYNLFMGIKEMAELRGEPDIADEAYRRWRQYLMFTLAVLLGFALIIVPGLAIAYIIFMLIMAIVLTTVIMKFMRRCGEYL